MAIVHVGYTGPCSVWWWEMTKELGTCDHLPLPQSQKPDYPSHASAACTQLQCWQFFENCRHIKAMMYTSLLCCIASDQRPHTVLMGHSKASSSRSSGISIVLQARLSRSGLARLVFLVVLRSKISPQGSRVLIRAASGRRLTDERTPPLKVKISP